jgi:cyclic beta-1,2-glucan synthetase
VGAWSIAERIRAFIVTEISPKRVPSLPATGTAFGSRVAFADLAGRQTNWTGDRREFLGRNGTLDNPAALATGAPPLSKRVGAGLDPCGVLQAPLGLDPDERVDIILLLGEAATAAEAQSLMRATAADLTRSSRRRAALERRARHRPVSTPDRSMDIMLNRWLLYQTPVCRMWGDRRFIRQAARTVSATNFRTEWHLRCRDPR